MRLTTTPTRLLRAILILIAAALLAACGRSGSDTSHTVEGIAFNGPLVGATVEVMTPVGGALGTTTTDEDGLFTINVAEEPPYRIKVTGGTLDGVPYTGTLLAHCESDYCAVTPLSTVAVRLMDDHGFGPGDAAAHLANLLGFDSDPFVDDGIGADLFDLDTARAAIGDGDGLEAWIDAFLAWQQDSDQPPPAGVPEPDTYTVTPSAGAGGSIDPNTPQTVNHGSTASFTLTPDTGYSIDEVGGTCGGNLVGDTYTTDAITEDCTVTASFSPHIPDTYTVTPSAGAGGSIDPNTPQTVNHGSTASFTVTPETGYSINEVGGTCGGSLDGNTYTTNAITGNCTVEATFSLNQYTVTPSAGAGGSIAPDAPQTVGHGSTASFTLTPDIGYSIDEVGGTCEGSLDNGTFTTDEITGNCTVMASFAINQYTLTYSAGTGGTIVGESSQTVNHGADGTEVEAVPDSGFEFDQWSDGLETATRTDTNITANLSVSAQFVPSFVTLAAPANVVAMAGDGEVTVSWDAVDGATGYNLFWSREAGINPDFSPTWDDWMAVGNVTRYTVGDLTNGTEYFFIVTATAADVESEASDEVSAIPETPSVTQGILNDTGIDWWADGNANFLNEPQADYPGQDADFGRDAEAREGTLVKLGGGAAGFDFTKLGADGEPLAIQDADWSDAGDETSGTRWSCVRDNRTGLIWEVKVNNPDHLRHQGHTYTWYNSDASVNGGWAGSSNGGICVDEANCDTEKFVAAVNSAGLCGGSDWRMPTAQELLSIVHNGRDNPTIDQDYFPNTPSDWSWSSSPNASSWTRARSVNFDYGRVTDLAKESSRWVRLVRAGQ